MKISKSKVICVSGSQRLNNQLSNIIYTDNQWINNDNEGNIYPFISNAPFFYPLKTSKKRCFQWVEKGCSGSKWIKTPELQLRFSRNRGANELVPSFIQLLIERLNP